jgi:O-antigen ligase
MYQADKNLPAGAITPWVLVVTAYLALMTLTGGISVPSTNMALLHATASVAMLLSALAFVWRQGYKSKMAALGTAIIMAVFAVLLLQLVPLPPSLWTMLPGREIVVKNYELLNVGLQFAPLSLTPSASLQSAMAFLAASAAYLSAVTLSSNQLRMPVAGIVICALISALIALVQNFLGAGSWLYFYDAGTGNGSGTFNNRNFFALQMVVFLPLLAALVLSFRERKVLASWAIAPIAAVASIVLLTGLATANSRTGILLAVPAITFSLIMVYRARRMEKFSATAFGLVGILLGLLIIGQASLVGFLRLAETDVVNEIRSTINEGSLKLLQSYYSAGAGFGSYVPLYETIETPARMQANFINHAHNDWLEVLIEGGLPIAVLLALGVVWLIAMAFRVWRYMNSAKIAPFHVAATIIVPIMLAHSAVDYPLRTPALMVLFAFLCGVMTLPVTTPSQFTGRRDKSAEWRSSKKPGAFRPTASAAPPEMPPQNGSSKGQAGRDGHTSNTLSLQ